MFQNVYCDSNNDNEEDDDNGKGGGLIGAVGNLLGGGSVQNVVKKIKGAVDGLIEDLGVLIQKVLKVIQQLVEKLLGIVTGDIESLLKALVSILIVIIFKRCIITLNYIFCKKKNRVNILFILESTLTFRHFF